MINSIIHSVFVLTPPTYSVRHHRVSVYTRSGQFINCFGIGRGEGDLNDPEEVAVDNTTGALYVCDSSSNCVVVY